MSTRVTIAVEDRSRSRAEDAIGRALDELDRVTAILTRFEAASAVGVLNAEGRLGSPPPELSLVLKRALEIHQLSGGAFDPTVAPLVDLYHLHFAAHGGPPDEAEVHDVRAIVGAGGLRLDLRGVAFDRTGMALTLDGIAKGYIVDRVVETLAACGVRHALVNAGGDIRALGPRADGLPWRVGVQDPREPGALVETIGLADAAVATSGDYVRFHDVDRRYHHTIVPATGRSPGAVSSVTVRARTAMDADALATAVFALGPDAGTACLARAGLGAEALILTRDNRRCPTSGWKGA